MLQRYYGWYSSRQRGTRRKANRDWWINFYHVLDPVSGALESTGFCEPAPINLHIKIGQLPGWAHVAYWHDLSVLRFILARTLGKERLPDVDLTRRPAWKLRCCAALANITWAAIGVGGLVLLWFFGPDVLKWLVSGAWALLSGG